MLDHSFTNYVSNGNATCTADGTKTATCDNCTATDTITDEGSKLAHTYTISTVTAPTCTEEGYTTYACICGDSYVTDKVPATGHKWVAAGDGNKKCSVCDATEICADGGHTIAVERRNVVTATCTRNGEYDRVEYCSVCNTVLDTLHVVTERAPHTLTTRIENEIPATDKQNGSYEEITYCSAEGCGEVFGTKTVITPATGSDDDSDINTGSGIKCSWWERFIAWIYRIFAAIKQVFTGMGW